MVLKVGYWEIRGMVEPIHLVLEYTETPYERIVYSYSDTAQWFEKDKKSLGVDFPNIPYLVEGDSICTQSYAILKYLGRKNKLFGSEDLLQMAEQEAVFDTVADIRAGFSMMCYMPGHEANKKDYFEKLPAKLALLDARLSKHKWLMGDQLYIGDFNLWSILDYHECMDPNVLNGSPNVARFKKEFSQIPQIAKYLASDRFKKFPVNGAIAQWGWNPV